MEREWQKNAKISLSDELIALNEEYEMRKSKFIKMTATNEELRKAMRLYKMLLEDCEKGVYIAVKTLKALEIVTGVQNIEDQIKLVGCTFEMTEKYPAGIKNDEMSKLLDLAEKWGVLDYVMDEVISLMLRKERGEDDKGELLGRN